MEVSGEPENLTSNFKDLTTLVLVRNGPRIISQIRQLSWVLLSYPGTIGEKQNI